MEQGDKVKHASGKEWLGTVVWADKEDGKVGVVYDSPSTYAGGSNTYKVDELTLVSKVTDVQSRYDSMSVDELRAEIDALRSDRGKRLSKPTTRKVYSKKEPNELHILAMMIEKHGVEKVKEALKGGTS